MNLQYMYEIQLLNIDTGTINKIAIKLLDFIN